MMKLCIGDGLVDYRDASGARAKLLERIERGATKSAFIQPKSVSSAVGAGGLWPTSTVTGSPRGQ
jgi:hypothetical protein